MMFDRILFHPGRIRPMIRLAYSVAGIVTLSAAAAFMAIAMPAPNAWLPHHLAFLFWFSTFLLPVLLAFYAILTRLGERKPLGSVGLAFHPRWKSELLTGLVAGAAMILAVASLEGLLGAAKFSLASSSAGKIAPAAGFFLLLLMVAAADEELIFRGYPFQRLVDSVGPLWAVTVSSVVFGAAHWGNPSHSWISTLNTAAVGVLLAVCYLRTRALWLPLGIHFSWNFVQGFLLGLPVSGFIFPITILRPKVAGPSWLTGSAYGPEGSILSLGVIAAGTVYFFVSRRVILTREMQKLALCARDEKETGIAPSISGRCSD